MLRWLALGFGGIAWGAVLLLFAALLQPRVPAGVPAPDGGTGLVRELNQPQEDAGGEWWSWKVVKATSAHRAMVVDVEAQRVGEARAIAAQIVEPVRSHGYDEILVYVHPPGNGAGGPAARRVQWTPRGGYTELIMTD